MGAWDATAAATSLSAALGITTYPSVPGTHLRLGTTAPTATAAMTELTGSGYTAGGLLITWAAPSGDPASTTNTNSPSWANGTTLPWLITGGEIWTTNTSPVRQFQGTWAGAPVVIAPGDSFAPAVAGVLLSQE